MRGEFQPDQAALQVGLNFGGTGCHGLPGPLNIAPDATLFGAGQPLDATRFFIILPDAIGHGVEVLICEQGDSCIFGHGGTRSSALVRVHG